MKSIGDLFRMRGKGPHSSFQKGAVMFFVSIHFLLFIEAAFSEEKSLESPIPSSPPVEEIQVYSAPKPKPKPIPDAAVPSAEVTGKKGPKKGTARYLLNRGNHFYGLGDCTKSVHFYEKILQSKTNVDEETRTESLFRAGYCYTQLEHYEDAENRFEEFLKIEPENEEARMKYMEVLFAQNKHRDVIEAGNLISSPSYLASAHLMMAQSHLQLEENDEAIASLNAIPKSPDWDPVVSYWRGVAYFNSFDDSSAIRSFIDSRKRSRPSLWTRTASENWLQSIKESRRFLRGQIDLGYLYDGNLGQSTYKNSGETIAEGPASYTKDQAYTLGLRLETRPLGGRRFFLVPSLSYLSSFYREQKTYSSEAITAQLTAAQVLNSKFSLRESVSFLDSRYQYRYSPTAALSFNLSGGLTKQIRTRPATIRNLSGGTFLTTGSLYWTASVNASTAKGEAATYVASTSTAPYELSSGVTGSNYTSEAFTLGMGTHLFWGMDGFLQYTYTGTQYAAEVLPSGAAETDEARRDLDRTWQISLSRALVEKRLTLNLIYSRTTHRSVGFQGLLYSTDGASPNYNYSRNQAQLVLGLNL
jgi:tetratricopeptide (TPR) repeat protein